MHRRVELVSRHRGPANLTRQRSHRTGAPGGAAAAIQRRHPRCEEFICALLTNLRLSSELPPWRELRRFHICSTADCKVGESRKRNTCQFTIVAEWTKKV